MTDIQAGDNIRGIVGHVIVEIHDAKTGRLKWKKEYHNLFVDAGKASIAEALRGNVDNSKGQITYCAVGSGTNAPAAGDIKLQNEVYRKAVSVRSAAVRTATFKTFFNQNEANGTLRELGLFGDLATNTRDSGTLFARLNINRTKSSTDTLTITHSISLP